LQIFGHDRQEGKKHNHSNLDVNWTKFVRAAMVAVVVVVARAYYQTRKKGAICATGSILSTAVIQ